jgi:hypothetical protein
MWVFPPNKPPKDTPIINQWGDIFFSFTPPKKEKAN